MSEEMVCRKRRLSSFQIIILGFAGVILLGALLLMLPLSTTAGCVTPFHEALFTATSAVCVTGLVVQDTGSYWSAFGQAVILTLIQIGGLGVVTVAASFALLSGRRISLMQRSTMQDAISAPKVGGIVRLTRFILRGTFLIELIGALAMLPVFCRDYGWHGIWLAVFHSISAFCNAGFDILGTNNNLYPSLTGYVQNPVINITIMLLIITGGIGFLTWDDICENKLHIHRYRMQSKVILVTTLVLIVLPALFFFFVDFDALPLGERVQAALFQSVTPRTAGFNTVNLSAMSGASQGMMILLMLIGGSPGSTAGGMKTTTLAVLLANAAATFRQRDSAQFFGRRVDCGAVKTAATILTMYLALFFGGAVFISVYENLPLSPCLYETASAVGTVGLTLGITPQLHIPSQMVLIALSRRADTHLCGGVQQKKRQCKAAAGKNYDWISKGVVYPMKNVLLIGAGRFGRHIAMQLSQLGHQVMAVDTNEERINDVLPFVTNAQIGDSTNAEFLRSLGIGNFDVCFVTISGSFQNSLETTSLLKELGAKCVVSRAERDVQAKFLLRNGADNVVYPEKQMAKWAAIRFTADHIFDYIEIDEQHAIFEVQVPEAWVGKSVGELDVRRKFGINILGIKRAGKTDVSVTPDTVLSDDITILTMGEYKALQKCFRI